MEFTYRNRKHLAKITLVSLVFILLLALNLKVWGGTSGNDAHLNICIGSQSILLNHYILSDNYSRKNVRTAGYIGIIVISVFLSFIRFIWKYRNSSFYEKKYTLVTLCVRMDE